MPDPPGSAYAPRPVVDCPAGSHRENNACIADNVECPPGSSRVGPVCVGRVVCPDRTEWTGSRCEPEGGLKGKTPGAGLCTFDANAIPPMTVYLDGVNQGMTPKFAMEAPDGVHTFLFYSPEHGSRVVTATCGPGQKKTVLARLLDEPRPRRR